MVGLGGLCIVGPGRQGDNDVDGALQLAQIGDGLGGKGIPPMLAEVEAPVIVQRKVIEAGEQGEEQDGLEHQVDGAEPAGGAITLNRQHGAGQL